MNISVNGVDMVFEARAGLFSPAHADRGTLAMLGTSELAPGMRALDLGCGWGLVGVYAARICGAENVFFADIDPEAVACAAENARRNGLEIKGFVSDGFAGISEAGFDVIFSNPPYQSDFSVAKGFIEKGFNRLRLGGKMYMVTKRRKWYENKLRAIFGGAKVLEIDGYFVFIAEKRGSERGKSR